MVFILEFSPSSETSDTLGTSIQKCLQRIEDEFTNVNADEYETQIRAEFKAMESQSFLKYGLMRDTIKIKPDALLEEI